MRILIAEDDPISQRLMKTTLDPHGACDIVSTGKDAVESFEMAIIGRIPYDLVCLDIMMPQMDGQEALKLIREIEQHNGIDPSNEVKIIMTTALDNPQNVFEAYYQGGATSYLPKPVRPKKLISLLVEMGLIEGNKDG